MFFVLLEQLFWLKKNYVFKKYFTKNSSKDDLIFSYKEHNGAVEF